MHTNDPTRPTYRAVWIMSATVCDYLEPLYTICHLPKYTILALHNQISLWPTRDQRRGGGTTRSISLQIGYSGHDVQFRLNFCRRQSRIVTSLIYSTKPSRRVGSGGVNRAWEENVLSGQAQSADRPSKFSAQFYIVFQAYVWTNMTWHGRKSKKTGKCIRSTTSNMFTMQDCSSLRSTNETFKCFITLKQLTQEYGSV